MSEASLKVLHIAPSFYPAIYWGGPIFSVYGLCNALPRPGVELKVLTTDSAGPRLRDRLPAGSIPNRHPSGYDIFVYRRWWGRSFSPGLLLSLPRLIRWADVVQLTAVYSSPTLPTLLLCRLFDKPLVWSPVGTLQRWHGTTKPLAKALWERACNLLIKRGRCVLHVTSEQEAADSLARLPRAVARLIPNGVDVPPHWEREWRPNGRLRLLFLGRLDPKKGVENLLQALAALDETVSLTICGGGAPDYAASLRRLARDLGLGSRVNFAGLVDADGRSEHLRRADLCVVPSFTENFGMVVVESLAHGVPVVAGKGTPWSELESRGCGLWVDNDPPSLAAAIRRTRAMDLPAMGQRGRDWMRRDFGWAAAADRMLTIHRALGSGCRIGDG